MKSYDTLVRDIEGLDKKIVQNLKIIS